MDMLTFVAVFGVLGIGWYWMVLNGICKYLIVFDGMGYYWWYWMVLDSIICIKWYFMALT